MSLELPPVFCAESGSVCVSLVLGWKGFLWTAMPPGSLEVLMLKSDLLKSLFLKPEPFKTGDYNQGTQVC